VASLTPVIPGRVLSEYEASGVPWRAGASAADSDDEKITSHPLLISLDNFDEVGHPCPALAWSDPSDLPDLRGVVALVVDDDADAREIFAASLTHVGAEVQTAASARQALTILEARVPDVVVTDMSMPGEDGLWLLNAIKSQSPEAARVPVVAVTGHRHLYGDRDMLAAGFERYMMKPVDPWQLCGTVGELTHDTRRG
jgi:CheY-like chemotaxis protein